MATLLHTNDGPLMEYDHETLVVKDDRFRIPPTQLALFGLCCIWAAWFSLIGHAWKNPARSG